MNDPAFTKISINGYHVLSINSGDWKVCTKDDRLASFASRQEALAYAAALPTYMARSPHANQGRPLRVD